MWETVEVGQIKGGEVVDWLISFMSARAVVSSSLFLLLAGNVSLARLSESRS